MYEEYFGMQHTPFTRDVPPEALYESAAMADALGRLSYAADHQLFAVVTSESGCGKSTLIRKFAASLDKDKYILLYILKIQLINKYPLYLLILNLYKFFQCLCHLVFH